MEEDYDYYEDYCEALDKIAELEERMENYINAEDLILRLKLDNKYTPEVEQYIENYMKWNAN